jgi:putative membrane protein
MTKVAQANPKQDSKIMIAVAVLSVAIPLVVAVLLYIPQTGKLGDLNVSFLPTLNAVLNSFTALCLIVGYYFVKNKNVKGHRIMMVSAFVASSLFLVSYVLYHFQAPSTRYGDINGDGVVDAVELAAAGVTRTVYFVILLSHIVLAAIVVPFVLLSIYFGLTNQVDRHRKLSKWTFPIWLYVAITGVVVFLMISPYYAH